MKNAIILLAILVLTGCAQTFPVRTETLPNGTVTNYAVVNPTIENGLHMAETVNDLTAPFNPYAGFIKILLAGVVGSLGWFANRQTAKLNETKTLFKTAVQGVENAPDNDAVKKSIALVAAAKEIGGKMDDAVQKTLRAT